MKSLKERALGEAGSKKKVNSKVKGNRNEVQVAKALSKWTGVEFRRTPASGAIHVPLDWLAGDVFCTNKDFDFPFSVETKHYKEITNYMQGKFWAQACIDADRIGKEPLLMVRENNFPKDVWLVYLPYKYYYYLHKNEIPYIPMFRKAVKVLSADLFKIDYNEFAQYVKHVWNG